MPWGQTGIKLCRRSIPVWTGSGLDGFFSFGEEQTTITCTIDMQVIIQEGIHIVYLQF